MPAGRHRNIAARARKAHAKRPTKHQRPLTVRQKAKVEACIEIADMEADRFARIHGQQARIDDLRTHAYAVLLEVARNHVQRKSPLEAFARGIIRKSWRQWFSQQRRNPVAGETPSERIDHRPWPEENAERNELASHMAEAMSMLGAADRFLLQRVVVQGETLKDVGESMGYTLNRIHQLRNEALERLKAAYMGLIYGELPDLFNSAA